VNSSGGSATDFRLLVHHVRASGPPALVALATALGPIVATYGNEAMPVDYLLRPVLIASAVAVIVGVLASLAGRYANLLAFVATLLLMVPSLWPVIPIAIGAEAAIQFFQKIRQRPRPRLGSFVRSAMVILLLVGVARAGPPVLAEISSASEAREEIAAPAIYLILLDGYPRIDTLGQLGYDNRPFIQELVERGFDHYPETTSAHGYTHLTLADMFAGKDTQLPDEQGHPDNPGWQQRQRLELRWPAEYTVFDPPLGHVRTVGGRHWYAGGITDLEAFLLGRSMLGIVARDATSRFIADSLRDTLARTLERTAETPATSVFAHVMSPHPPFLYSEDLPECWTLSCDAFTSWQESLGLTTQEWAARAALQLDGLNADLLETVDEILTQRPDAVIVLFSDHGARYSRANRATEWHNSFLAARTPGNPGLFEDEPHPYAVLRLVTETYR
jgi:hypothetical protein